MCRIWTLKTGTEDEGGTAEIETEGAVENPEAVDGTGSKTEENSEAEATIFAATASTKIDRHAQTGADTKKAADVGTQSPNRRRANLKRIAENIARQETSGVAKNASTRLPRTR